MALRSGTVVLGLLAACAALASPAAGATSLSGHGISLRLPAGWTGVVYQRIGGLPVVHAASFRLPPIDEDDGAVRAVSRMRRDEVLIVMLEATPRFAGYPKRALPLRLRRADFGAPVEGMPLSHAFARIEFSTAGRAFNLWVEFGGKPAPAAAIHAARRVLATLHVRRGAARL